MTDVQRLLDDHELENALLTRIPEPSLEEVLRTQIRRPRPAEIAAGPRARDTGPHKSCGVPIWPAHPRPDGMGGSRCGHRRRRSAARRRHGRPRAGKDPSSGTRTAPSQWHNLGQNARVRQELSAIEENLNGECDQAELNDLFDRFLEARIPEAATEETTPKRAVKDRSTKTL